MHFLSILALFNNNLYPYNPKLKYNAKARIK